MFGTVTDTGPPLGINSLNNSTVINTDQWYHYLGRYDSKSSNSPVLG